MKSLIRTIDAWRFERPLGLALGASTLFALLAMPAPRYAALPAVGRLVQPLGALVTAIALAALGWYAMRRPVPQRARVRARPLVKPAVFPEATPDAEPVVRLRRADRHPDAPAREPIRAHRDLGSPFMEVDTAPRPTVVDVPPPPPIDIEAITVATPAIEEAPAPTPEPIAEVVEDVPAADTRESVMEATPSPATIEPIRANGRADLGGMIDRLAAGLTARAASPAPRAPTPALVDALEELNRIAARRR